MDMTVIPDSLGQCVDMLEVIKAKKSSLEKQKKELDKYASMILESVKPDMEKQGVTECAGTNMRFKFVTDTKYSLGNKETFLEYVRENDAFEMMTCAVNQSAVRERVSEEQQIPPGVTAYDVTSAKLTKKR